jgi:hypothetical protein
MLARLPASSAIIGMVMVAGCDRPPVREPSLESLGAQVATVDSKCRSESARPASMAPAEGLWAYRDSATSLRVAAIIGPAGTPEGSTRVTRAVETLESLPGDGSIRHTTDTASVRLEFIPPFTRPAAVYAIDQQVILAAYEPCGASTQEPLLRYLRRDALGYLATDVMLQREARP